MPANDNMAATTIGFIGKLAIYAFSLARRLSKPTGSDARILCSNGHNP